MKGMFSRSLMFTLMACAFLTAKSQDSLRVKKGALIFSAYAEGYYAHDMQSPEDHQRPSFLYNFSKSTQPNINLAWAKLGYTRPRWRANLALAAGTYVDANYAPEPAWAQPLFEANAGFRLSGKKDLWIDAGVMPSHIGFESATGKENWTLSRSMVAENSPYFETGVRLSYTTADARWYMAALALTGWQRITRVPGSKAISLGFQVTYRPGDQLTLNYSNFFGPTTPDSSRNFRTYHNLYAMASLNKQWGLIFGVDLGTDDPKGGSGARVWYTPVIIARYKPHDKWAVALRTEYFNDTRQVLIPTGTANGFRTFGESVNVDYQLLKKLLLRLEYRAFQSKDRIFYGDPSSIPNNQAITFSAAWWF